MSQVSEERTLPESLMFRSQSGDTLHGHEMSDESDEAFLGAVGDNNWQVDIEVNDQVKKF